MGLVVAGAALVGASPASAALESYSPSAKMGAWSQANDTQVAVMNHKTGVKGYANYYRTTDPSAYYTTWNKSGIINNIAYSNIGNRVTSLRTCNWVPDNDDECARWERG
ncbi:hypothetical protein AB0M94_26090 [Streptomyces xanthochromogenes]|uniref:hypothetical protein n=1 Tax=Streptomyces TaxID=1883 RepID=UPI0013700344|nr:hypothetical protein [Streptomyces sp. SID1034]MYV93913.1 hypothetical protein [Streptomyces sp. SID1034]